MNSIRITVHPPRGPAQTYVLDKDEIRIGRAGDSDLQLSDATVSRRHARLVRQGGRLRIEDLGSSSGIYVNGRSTHGQPAELRPGDRVTVGGFTLEIQRARPAGEPLPEPEIAAAWFTLGGLGADAVSVGSAFAFVHRSLYEDPQVQRLIQGLGFAVPQGSRTEPLLGDGEVALPGLTLKRHRPAAPALCSVTSDKMLYQEGRDTINLLVIDVRRAGQEAQVEILLNGDRLARKAVALDGRGLGHLDLPDPLAGSYEVRLGEAAKCTFLVAGYTLAALSATLLSHRYAEQRGQQQLTATVGLRSYGLRFQGAVRVQLEDVGQTPPVPVGAPQMLTADDLGRVEVTVQLSGEGPFSLSLQSVEDAERTASLPLPGTRAAERRLFRVSRLGEVVDMSLLPRPGSQLSHGLHLGRTGEREEAPLRLRAVVCTRAELEVMEAIEALCLVLYDPASGQLDVRQAGDVAPGQVLTLDVPPWYGVLCAGGFVDGRPWEGWAAVLRPERQPVALEVPAQIPPGGTLEVALRRTDGGTERLTAFVIVKDARLQAVETPLSQLGAATKRGIEALAGRLHVGAVDRPAGQLRARRLSDLERDVDALRDELLRHAEEPGPIYAALPQRPPQFGMETTGSFAIAYDMAAPPPPRAGSFPMAPPPMPVMMAAPAAMPPPAPAAPMRPAPEMRASVMMAPGGAPPAAVEGSLARQPAPAPAPEKEEAPETDERPGEVLLCQLIELSPGTTRIAVPVPDGPASYRVEVFVLAGWDFSLLTAEVQAQKQLFVSLVVPPFCDPRDTVFGKVDVGSRVGLARVIVTRDGVPVPLYAALPSPSATPADLSGRPLECDALFFPLSPGRYRAAAACGDLLDEAEAIVSQPGRVTYLRQRTRLLSPGESVDLARDGGLRLRVLPGLDQPFGQLIETTADYGHACCEQTAAKLLAAVAMYLCAAPEDERGRARAARIIRAGVAREERMWVPGKGFRMYPESDYFSDYYGRKAALYLHRLRGLGGLPLPRDLKEAAARGLQMAQQAAAVYRLELVPRELRSCEDAYLAAQASEERRREAARFVRHVLEQAQKRSGAVAQRTEDAYAAATLLLSGDRSDLARALEVANRVIGAFNQEGRLYSTVDSVAAIALLSELRARGIGAGGRFLGDGERRETSGEADGRGYKQVMAEEGVITVQVLTLEHEELCAAVTPGNLPAAVRLEHPARGPGEHFQLADRLTLVVHLTDGYQAGDLLHVHLPPALTFVHGGGQVRALALDFAGRGELRVPLLATSTTVDRAGQPAPQHFALAVRNMFEEERGRGFPDLRVTISARGGPGRPGEGAGEKIVSRISRALKDLIGS
jgi:pSer/pThr/pTyr-binding forkhead associated (FHA) protein